MKACRQMNCLHQNNQQSTSVKKGAERSHKSLSQDIFTQADR